MKEDIYAIRCFINGKRHKTHQLTKKQAKCFLVATRHLAKFLKREYKIKVSSNNNNKHE